MKGKEIYEKRNMKVIICIGIPASGKSTWAKSFCHENPNFIRINRDDFRRMRGDYWIPEQENLITKFENSCTDIALASGFNVIIDATNLNEKFSSLLVNRLLQKFPEIEIEFKLFDITFVEAITRDNNREDKVGEEVIERMFIQYNKLKNSGKLIPNINEQTRITPIVQNPKLKCAVICDIDGTVALKGERSAYDMDKVDLDLPNKPVIELLESYVFDGPQKLVIFVSGRNECAREKTKKWLIENVGNYTKNSLLFMRADGDMRNDAIVKKEIFDTYIKDKFYINFALDDRNSIVELWRKLGLTCLQVADGNF